MKGNSVDAEGEFDSHKDSKSGSSGRRKSSSRKRERKLDIGYYRVLGIRDKDATSQNSKKYESIASTAKSTGILHFFSGEKKEDRNTRLKMSQYKQLLQADLKLAEKAAASHLSKQEALQQEFKEQEMQLWRWGLEHLIQDFRMQAWLREDRGELLVNMSSIIVGVIQGRLREIQFTLSALKTKPSMRLPREKESLGAADDSFYVAPEKLLERHEDYVAKRARLNQFDKLCHAASVKFRELLPELNSKTYGEREMTIHGICARYAELMDDHNLSVDIDVVSSASWPEFCVWYSDKCSQEIAIYADFLRFVDDEREREGRLFRRWCSLLKSLAGPSIYRINSGVTSVDSSGHGTFASDVPPKDLLARAAQASTESSVKSSSQGDGAQSNGEKKGIEANAKYMSHPRAVQTFIRYFALNILSQYYSVPPNLQSTLVALTDVVIHRNVYDALFVYPTLQMKKQDRIWRLKSQMCRYIDPVEYAVEAQYLGRNQKKANHHDQTSGVGDTAVDDRICKADIAAKEDDSPTHGTKTTGKRRSKLADQLREAGKSMVPEGTHSIETAKTPGGKSRAVSMEQKISITPFMPVTLPGGEANGDAPLTPLQPMRTDLSERGSYSQVQRRVMSDVTLFKASLDSGEDTTDLDGDRLANQAARSKDSDAREFSVDSINLAQVSLDSILPPASSPSVQGSSSNSKSSSRRRRSSRFSKDTVCESLLKSVTGIGPLNYRVENLLVADLSCPPDTPDEAFATAQTSDTTVNSEGKSTTLGIVTPTSSKRTEDPTSTSSPHTRPPSALIPLAPYARAARVLGLIDTSMCPREMIATVLMSMVWLIRTTSVMSGKSEALGADSVFPIIVNTLINANIPNMHLVLHYITTYAAVDTFGEAAYYITCLTAAVRFVDSMEIPTDIQHKLLTEFQLLTIESASDDDEDSPKALGEDEDDTMTFDDGDVTTRQARSASEIEDRSRAIVLAKQEKKEKELGDRAVQHLGEWLRDQQVMEDTMVVMMQEGWMG